jgi:hypothetical protein
MEMLELLPWVLVIQLWTDPPPKMKFIYKKEYPNYVSCMKARDEWLQTNNPPPDFKVLCLIK